MTKSAILVILFSSVLSAQVQLGKGVQVGAATSSAGNPTAPGGTLQGANKLATAFTSTGINMPGAFQSGAGSGDGITNFFGTNPTVNTNLFGLIDSGEGIGGSDPIFPVPNGSTVFDFRTNWANSPSLGQMAFGIRSNNCAANTQLIGPFGSTAAYCTVFLSQDTIAMGTGGTNGAGRGAFFAGTSTNGPGTNMGNPSGFFNSDLGVTLSGCCGFGANSARSGIMNGLTVNITHNALGDTNMFRINGTCAGGDSDGSGEGCKGIAENIGEITTYVTSATVATAPGGTGSTTPTFSNLQGSQFFAVGTQIADTAVSVAGTMTGQSTFFTGSGVLQLSHTADGSGYTASPSDTVTSITASSGGTAILNGSFPTCGANACANTGTAVGGFQNQVNNGVPGAAFLITASSTTQLTINNPYAVAETALASASILAPATCPTGSGGGFWALVSSDTHVHINGFITDAGTGYTNMSTCTVPGNPGGSGATFQTTTVTNMQILPITVSSGTLKTIAAKGIINTYIPSNSSNPQVNATFANLSVTNQNGTALQLGPAYIVNDATQEIVNITACAPVVGPNCTIGSGHQTITISSHLAHSQEAYIFQTPPGAGVGDGVLSLDANLNQGGWASNYFVAGAPDATHLYVMWPLLGSLSTASIPGGGYQDARIVGGFSGFHFYPACMVLFNDAVGNPTCGVNTVPWTIGDNVYQQHHPSFVGQLMGGSLIVNTPMSAAGDQVVGISYGGNHMSGGLNVLNIANTNLFGRYQGCDSTSGTTPAGNVCLPITGTGGPLSGPTIMAISGPYQDYLKANPPLPSGCIICMNDSGAARYPIVSSQGSQGGFNADPPQGTYDFDNSIFVASTVTTGNFHLFGIGGSTGDIFLKLVPDISTTGGPMLSVYTNSSPALAPVSAGGFYGAPAYVGALPPGIAGVFINGTGGATNYGYAATCLTSAGHESLPSALNATGGGNAILNGTNFNFVKFAANAGCQYMRIYRRANGGGLGTGLIADNVSPGAQGANDTGQAATTAEPTTDTSGSGFYVGGSSTLAGAVTVGGSGHSIGTGTASNSDLAGQLTLAGGTATFTFAGTYVSSPICVATDTTATNAVKASATTTVLTLTGTGTDVLNYICIARN